MEAFRWEIGNWEYPAGLFPSASLEQREYAMDWQEFEQSMAELALPDHQERLELLALKVLKRLIDEGVFSQATSLKGYTILGPDDTQALLLKKKSRVDRHLNAGNK